MSASVLVVDDDPAFQLLAVAVLSAQGLTVAGCAGDAHEAIEAAERLRPGGVLLDVWLQSDDGFEVARRLSALDPAPTVVLMSSDAGAASPTLARTCGAVGFVAKAELMQSDLRAYFESEARPADWT